MTELRLDIQVGTDGVARCGWVGEVPESQAYHDHEWGQVTHGEQALFERMSLEAFQSGLSWLTILRKREGFRAAFAGFDVDTVAHFTDADQARLLSDERIVRNRAKIAATIANARAILKLRATAHSGAGLSDDPLDALIWSFAPSGQRPAPRALRDVPGTSSESTALAKEMKRQGFSFIGPTTAYAMMQACGLVNDHVVGCHAR